MREAAPGHAGHRDRLRARFMKMGLDGVADYELLELILFAALPRRDVKPLAKALIARFGSVAEVISAPAARLAEVDGLSERSVIHLKVVQAAAQQMLRDRIIDRPVVSSWQALLDYCHSVLAYEQEEQFRVLFLDRKNALLGDEVQSRGTIDHTPVYPRQVIKRALELSASAIILVHNHPSGDPAPSGEDIAMTREIVEAGKRLSVTVHDHVIIGKKGHASFKSLGLI